MKNKLTAADLDIGSVSGRTTDKNKVTLYLGRALFQDIKDIAAMDDRSASYLIRKILMQFIDDFEENERRT
mgnify:CR=1 FL=1